MHILPSELQYCSKFMRLIAYRDRLQLDEVIIAKLVYVAECKHINKGVALSAVSSRLCRLSHYERRTITDTRIPWDLCDDRNQGPLDLLIKYEQKQHVDDLIYTILCGRENADIRYLGDAKALTEQLHVSRRRAQKIIKKWKDDGNQRGFVGTIGENWGDE